MENEFKFISPTRGEKYSISDVLDKLVQRRRFDCGISTVKYPPVYEYGNDYDGHIHIEATSVPSSWTDSIDCRLIADIPYHHSGSGAYSLGRWCSYPESGEKPPYMDNHLSVTVTAIFNGEEESLSFIWQDDYYEEFPQSSVQKQILKITKEGILQVAFGMLEGE